MKPCDCKDQQDTKSMTTQGMRVNDWTLSVEPAKVVLEHIHYGHVNVPMSVFKRFAEWYLKDQSHECDCENGCSSSKCDKR